ncbi:hypothetical protein BDZ45DRAFT_416778 [Acephala macrosclerotiorum]|nr:hypothetical protein BDZ45DRAFT_416778 [Acephala macrosclerotiorum]
MADPTASQEGFEVPSYTISYASDGTLQFNPPPNSPELAIASSIHFPMQIILKEKMRDAQLDFLRSQHQLQVPALAVTAGRPETRPTIPIATSPQMATEGDTPTFFVPQAEAQFRLFDSTMQQPTSASLPANQPKPKKQPRKSRTKGVTQAKTHLRKTSMFGTWIQENQHRRKVEGLSEWKRQCKPSQIEETFAIITRRSAPSVTRRSALKTNCSRKTCFGLLRFHQLPPLRASQAVQIIVTRKNTKLQQTTRILLISTHPHQQETTESLKLRPRIRSLPHYQIRVSPLSPNMKDLEKGKAKAIGVS